MGFKELNERVKEKLQDKEDAIERTNKLLHSSYREITGERVKEKIQKKLTPAQVVVRDVVALKKGERVLIIANPSTAEIAQDLYLAVKEREGIPTLIFQEDKTSFDNANPEVLSAIATEPEICFSISNIKLGKDPGATANPYKTEDGQEFVTADTIFLLVHENREVRVVVGHVIAFLEHGDARNIR